MVGSLQVDSEGSLASWQVPNKKMNGMGGAMDLVTSGSKVIVLMQHLNKGKLKILD
jgi:acyl CoA:acetate/3-ketoacid CoA transferase beta subunit